MFYQENYRIIRMDLEWEVRVDNAKLFLINRAKGVTPRQLVVENNLHDVPNEYVSKFEFQVEG
jgi:hypothetical protein